MNLQQTTNAIRLALAFALCGGVCTTNAAEPRKMLVITQSKGFVHGSVKRPKEGKKLSASEIALIQLGQQTKLFEATCSQDCAADFTKENLEKYDIVTFYTTGDLPIKEEDMKYFLEVWLKQKGHGFMGFHSATDTYKDFEPYWDMVGGVFNGHPWRAGNTVTIAVHDPNHPTMKPFGREFQIKDEIYQYKHWQPKKVRVLMSLDMEKCEPKRPYMVPVAWVKPWGEGKIYVNNLGHNKQTWTDKRFLKSIENGVHWINGDLKGKDQPNPQLSEELELRAQLADVTTKLRAIEKRKAEQASKREQQPVGAGK